MGLGWIITGAGIAGYLAVSVTFCSFLGRRMKQSDQERQHVALHEATVQSAVMLRIKPDEIFSCPQTVVIADFTSQRFVLGRRLGNDEMFLDQYDFVEVTGCDDTRNKEHTLMMFLSGRGTTQELLVFDNLNSKIDCWQTLQRVQQHAENTLYRRRNPTASPAQP